MPYPGIKDPGSRIRDLGSRIQDPGSWIQDPGSRFQDPGSRRSRRSWIQDPGSDPGSWTTGSRIQDPGCRILVRSLLKVCTNFAQSVYEFARVLTKCVRSLSTNCDLCRKCVWNVSTTTTREYYTKLVQSVSTDYKLKDVQGPHDSPPNGSVPC